MNETADRQAAPANSALEIAVNAFAAPAQAFRALKAEPGFLLPLLLLIAGAVAVQYIYLSGVDIQWLIQQTMGANRRVTEAQAEQAARVIGDLPPAAIAVAGALSASVAATVLFLLHALYFKIASAIAKDGLSYKHCFSLVCWSSLPTLLGSLASIVNLLMNDIRLMPSMEINPLAIWSYLGLEPLGTGIADQYVMNAGPTTLWSLILLILGYRIFTGRSTATATLVAVLPTAVIFGVAFAF